MHTTGLQTLSGEQRRVRALGTWSRVKLGMGGGRTWMSVSSRHFSNPCCFVQ